MEDSLPKTEDFYKGIQTKRIEYFKYFKHGIPFAIFSSLLFTFIGFVIDAFDVAYNLLIGSVLVAPYLFDSPFVGAAITLVLLCIGLPCGSSNFQHHRYSKNIVELRSGPALRSS